jgi:hypothetical protein
MKANLKYSRALTSAHFMLRHSPFVFALGTSTNGDLLFYSLSPREQKSSSEENMNDMPA